MTRQVIALLAFGLLTVDVLAQQVALPQFEVASIKRRNEPLFKITAPQGARPGGSFGNFNATLVRLVMYAFDLPDYRVLGGQVGMTPAPTHSSLAWRIRRPSLVRPSGSGCVPTPG